MGIVLALFYRNKFMSFLYLMFSVATAMIGYHRHGSVFWAIVDFIFTPVAWIKWLIFHQVSLSLIKGTFAFFLQ